MYDCGVAHVTGNASTPRQLLRTKRVLPPSKHAIEDNHSRCSFDSVREGLPPRARTYRFWRKKAQGFEGHSVAPQPAGGVKMSAPGASAE